MSVHQLQPYTAIQRERQRWHTPSQQIIAWPPVTKLSRLDRFNNTLNNIENGRWLWIILAIVVGLGDLGYIAELFGWRPL